jgi:hypothetical protein
MTVGISIPAMASSSLGGSLSLLLYEVQLCGCTPAQLRCNRGVAQRLSLTYPRPMEQSADFEIGTDELWEAVSDPEQMDWLGDEVELDLRPGGRGRVVEDGESRRLVVERVDVGRQLSFHWWPEDDARLISRVDLIVVPRPDGSRLVVRETLALSAGGNPVGSGAVSSAGVSRMALAPGTRQAQVRWAVRLGLLFAASHPAGVCSSRA